MRWRLQVRDYRGRWVLHSSRMAYASEEAVHDHAKKLGLKEYRAK